MYTSIRRAAYVLDAGAAPWTADYRALPYPEHWRKGLLGLCNFGRDEDKYLRTVPTRRLDGVLQTLAPDLVVRPRPRPPLGEGPPPEEDFWLYVPSDVPDPLPGRTLGQLLDAWLRTLGPKDTQADSGFRDLLLRTSSALKSDLPSWEAAEEVSLLTAPVGEGAPLHLQPVSSSSQRTRWRVGSWPSIPTSSRAGRCACERCREGRSSRGRN